jgi:hypothetical protein
VTDSRELDSPRGTKQWQPPRRPLPGENYGALFDEALTSSEILIEEKSEVLQAKVCWQRSEHAVRPENGANWDYKTYTKSLID